MGAWAKVKNSALEKIGSDSRNWASILMLIGLIIGIIGAGFNFKARIEKLETQQAEIQGTLKEKVDESVLMIHLSNIKERLDEMSKNLQWLVQKGK